MIVPSIFQKLKLVSDPLKCLKELAVEKCDMSMIGRHKKNNEYE